jgi:hypothetical protein
VRATSSNWAGYAVKRSGVRFRHVSGSWVQPAVDCSSGSGTYSAVWVGLGGSSAGSQALEQIGTEADCTSGGTARYATWYELVPDAAHGVRSTQTGPANFGTTTFTGANAVTTTAHSGAISDSACTAVAIDLASGGRRFVEARSAEGGAGGEATTGELDGTGAGFAVTFEQSADPAHSGPGQMGPGPSATLRR